MTRDFNTYIHETHGIPPWDLADVPDGTLRRYLMDYRNHSADVLSERTAKEARKTAKKVAKRKNEKMIEESRRSRQDEDDDDTDRFRHAHNPIRIR